MTGLRGGIAIAGVLLLSGCASAGPVGPSASSPVTASQPVAAASQTALPSALVPTSSAQSIPPSASAVATGTVPPTVEPTPTATVNPTPKPSTNPTQQPTPSATGKPSTPNLVVSKFTSDARQLALNVPTSFKVTVKNAGSEAAGSFQAVVTYSPKGSVDQSVLDVQSVDGLAGGQSVQLTFTGSISQGGDYEFTAFADSADDIAESKESDNTRTLELTSVSLPNLTFDAEGVRTRTCIGGPDANVQFGFGIDNIGTADASGTIDVSIKYYTSTGDSGDLEGDTIVGSIPAGTGYDEEICRMLPGSGSYEVHFVLDADHKIEESNDDDNTIQVDVDIP
jgi:subtilase family serine protease